MLVIQDGFPEVFMVKFSTSPTSFCLYCILAEPLLNFLHKCFHSNLNEECLHHSLVISYTLYTLVYVFISLGSL